MVSIASTDYTGYFICKHFFPELEMSVYLSNSGEPRHCLVQLFSRVAIHEILNVIILLDNMEIINMIPPQHKKILSHRFGLIS